jgi:DNA-binding NarL/FixJ family response regulator
MAKTGMKEKEFKNKRVYSSAFEALPAATIIFDPLEKKIIAANTQALALFEIKTDSSQPFSLKDFFPNSKALLSIFEKKEELDKGTFFRLLLETGGGTKLDMAMNASLFKSDNTEYLILQFYTVDKFKDFNIKMDDLKDFSKGNDFAKIQSRKKKDILKNSPVKRLEVICNGFIIYSVMKELLSEELISIKYTLYPDNYDPEFTMKGGFDSAVFALPSVTDTEIDLINDLLAENRRFPILVVSMKVSEGDIIRLIKTGVRGVITEEKDFSLIPLAIDAIAKGELWCSRMVLQQIFESDSLTQFKEHNGTVTPEILSERELEILKLIAIGMKNGEIAEKLFISYSTVASHVYNIFRKLGFNSRSEAIRYALTQNLI